MTLPNFFILGAAKCGTTSLANNLRAHPDVFIPEIKEVRFFDTEPSWAQGLAWYERFYEPAGGERALGDATPSYLYLPVVPPRLLHTVGGSARHVALLRDPVDRTYSHYWHRYREGEELRSFDAVLDEELGGAEGWGYVGRSRYAEQLRRYVDAFGRESIHVALFEEYVADPGAVYAAICRHLGVDDTFRPDDLGERYNTHFVIVRPRLYSLLIAVRAGYLTPEPVRRWLWSKIARFEEYVPIEAAARARLQDYFAPHNRELEAFLERDLRAVWGY